MVKMKIKNILCSFCIVIKFSALAQKSIGFSSTDFDKKIYYVNLEAKPNKKPIPSSNYYWNFNKSEWLISSTNISLHFCKKYKNEKSISYYLGYLSNKEISNNEYIGIQYFAFDSSRYLSRTTSKLTDKAIATRLGISFNTTKSNRNLFFKFGDFVYLDYYFYNRLEYFIPFEYVSGFSSIQQTLKVNYPNQAILRIGLNAQVGYNIGKISLCSGLLFGGQATLINGKQITSNIYEADGLGVFHPPNTYSVEKIKKIEIDQMLNFIIELNYQISK